MSTYCERCGEGPSKPQMYGLSHPERVHIAMCAECMCRETYNLKAENEELKKTLKYISEAQICKKPEYLDFGSLCYIAKKALKEIGDE